MRPSALHAEVPEFNPPCLQVLIQLLMYIDLDVAITSLLYHPVKMGSNAPTIRCNIWFQVSIGNVPGKF